MTGTHTVTALLQNESGSLNRLVSLFRRRGFSLASLNVGECEQPGYSRLTLVVHGDDETLRTCIRQLGKLIDVVSAEDLPGLESVQRELVLIRVDAPSHWRSEVIDIVEILGGKVIHLTPGALTIEFSEEPAKIDRLIAMLTPYGIGEIVRTGVVAMKIERPTPASQQRCIC